MATKTTKEAGAREAQQDFTAIHSRAMLVTVGVSVWSARRFDKKVTEEVNREHAASDEAGRYNKHLFADKAPSHKEVMRLAGQVRATHYANTLPWDDEGWRLLPSANYDAYTKAMRAIRAEFEAAVEAFLAEYPDLVIAAKDALNGLWKEDDYPGVNEIRRKFSMGIEYSPVPAAGDFRLDLPADQVLEIERTVKDRVERATQAAMRDAWQRLYDVVKRIHVRLTADKVQADVLTGPDKASIRNSLIESAQETAEVLARLNATQDPALEALRKRVLDELTQVDAVTLREDRTAREETAAKAAAILDAMKEFYG